MLKKIIIVLVIVVVAIQFIRPSKNQTPISEQAKSLFTLCPPSTQVHQILQKACLDCHSDSTSFYYWYTNIQPIGWWITWHIDDGKEGLNFSAFLDYSGKEQAKKLRTTKSAVNKGWMPLKSYTWTHKDAILTDGEKLAVAEWVDTCLRKIDSTANNDND